MAYDIRAKITLIGLPLGLLATLLGNIAGWLWAAPIWLWLVFGLGAAIWIEDSKRKPRLIRHFSGRDYRALYRPAAIRLARIPRDWRLYDWALRLAVIYPIGALVLIWAVTGRPGMLGTYEVLGAETRWWPKLVTLGSVVLVLSGPMLGNWASGNPNNVIRQASGWLTGATILVATSGTIALAFAGVGAGKFVFVIVGVAVFGFTVAGASAVTLALAVAVAITVTFAVGASNTGEVALAAAFAVAVAVTKAKIEGWENLAYSVFSALFSTTLCICIAFVPWNQARAEDSSVFLFLAVLPLLNAIFDYASYAVTLTLIRCGLRASWGAALIGVADLGAALVLFTASGATLILVIAGAHALSGVQLYPLAPMFDGIRQDPWSYLWLYLMLFSTIIPTLLHFAIAAFALTGLAPRKLRRHLVGWINDPDPVPATTAPLVVGLVWTVSLILPFAAMYGLYSAIAAFWPDVLSSYLAIFEWVARWVGELPAL